MARQARTIAATAASLLLATLGVLTAVTPASASGTHLVLRYADPRITESSGLVDLGSSLVTANDSGHVPMVFDVGPGGHTIGTTRLRLSRSAARQSDIEALAPAGGSRVWVGDIGDNAHRRRAVALYRVEVRAGRDAVVRPATYRLAYPDRRPHDAESLFVDASGRPCVVTKAFSGGIVYRTPARLSTTRVNRLQRVGSVLELATDAAMMPDRRHLLVRSYRLAAVYTYPGLQRVGDFVLPAQPQGEALSVGPGGRLRVGSEGSHSAVLAVTMPSALTAAVAETSSPTPSPSTSATPGATTGATTSASPSASTGPSPSSSVSAPSATSTRPRAARQAGEHLGVEAPGWSTTVVLAAVAAILAVGAIGIGLGLRRRP